MHTPLEHPSHYESENDNMAMHFHMSIMISGNMVFKQVDPEDVSSNTPTFHIFGRYCPRIKSES
jgi:hypothetical protein